MIGVLGGGQLGKMFVMAARTMGYRVTVLDPDPQAPAGSLANHHIVAAYTDQAALDRMAKTCQAITTEFENVPSESLSYLEEYCVVAPKHNSVGIAQHRRLEKEFLNQNGFQTTRFHVIRHASDIETASKQALFPAILKSCCFGYDGKGQLRVRTAAELSLAWQELGNQECILEAMVEIDLEVSVVVARSVDAQVKCFPVAENLHTNGILDISVVPARISPERAAAIQSLATRIAESLCHVGVLAVEFFVLRSGQVIINEIAPRPHNSGHYTLDVCICSQYEQQLRTLCGLKLGETQQLSPAVMVNILGDAWFRDHSVEQSEPDWATLVSEPGLRLHLYGKEEPRRGRKMGHFTLVADSVEYAWKRAIALRQSLYGVDPDVGR